jgi:hypothetical protein
MLPDQNLEASLHVLDERAQKIKEDGAADCIKDYPGTANFYVLIKKRQLISYTHRRNISWLR